jgi:hypothetical protein
MTIALRIRVTMPGIIVSTKPLCLLRQYFGRLFQFPCLSLLKNSGCFLLYTLHLQSATKEKRQETAVNFGLIVFRRYILYTGVAEKQEIISPPQRCYAMKRRK